MVGEELQRHETGQGAERLGDFGHSEKIRRLPCTIADDEAGGAHLGHELNHLQGAPLRSACGRYEDEEVLCLDALEGPVQHRLGRQALRLQIRGLLDLERDLLGGHGARAAAEQPDPTARQVLSGEGSDPFLHAERRAQRRRKLMAQETLAKDFRAGPMVSDAAGEISQDRDRRRVAYGVRSRPLLRNRPEESVRPYGDRSSLSGHERRPAARLKGALQRAGGVALGPAVADAHHAVPRLEVRTVEREVEGVYRPHIEAAAVLPQEMLADPGRVIRSADADEEQPLARGCSGGEVVYRCSVFLEDADERLGLREDGIVHVEGVTVSPFVHADFFSFRFVERSNRPPVYSGLLDWRFGYATSSPPQFEQTRSISAAQRAQKVHS